MFNNSDLGKELIKAQSEIVKNIVFSGGGAKGNHIYTACIQALDDLNVIPTIQGVAGSSAGAMIATMVAFGVEGQEAERAMSSVKPIAYRKATLYEQLKFRQHINEIIEEIGEIYQVMRTLIDQAITNYLTELDTANLEQKLLIGYESLQAKLANKDKVNFADLSLLNAIDPGKFKFLHITAVKKSTGEVVVFNQNTPNINIEDAYRASSALPLILTPILIEGEEYIDGGHYNNTPVNIFTNQPGRLLVFLFGSAHNPADAAYKAIEVEHGQIFNPGMLSKFEQDVLLKRVLGLGGNTAYWTSHEHIYQEIREQYAQNVVILDTGIETVDFAIAELKAKILQVTGYLTTMRWFQNNYGSEDCPFIPALEEKEFILSVCEHVFNHILHNPGVFRLENIININNIAKKYVEQDWQKLTMTHFIYELAQASHLMELVQILNHPSISSQVAENFSSILPTIISKQNDIDEIVTLDSLTAYVEQLRLLVHHTEFQQLVTIADKENIITHVDTNISNEFFTLTVRERLTYLNKLVQGEKMIVLKDILAAVILVQEIGNNTQNIEDGTLVDSELSGAQTIIDEAEAGYGCEIM